MTPQQAGVSAEAVAKLVERFRKRCAMKGGCQDSRDPEKCAWCECADLLEALATAPPEQAAPPKLHGTFTIADLPEDQPQAVSAGARSPNDEIHFQEGRLLGLTEGMHKCEELLAAHDQKVRREVCEQRITLEEVRNLPKAERPISVVIGFHDGHIVKAEGEGALEFYRAMLDGRKRSEEAVDKK